MIFGSIDERRTEDGMLEAALTDGFSAAHLDW
jgi:hypothetical protein